MHALADVYRTKAERLSSSVRARPSPRPVAALRACIAQAHGPRIPLGAQQLDLPGRHLDHFAERGDQH
jgi:hypothetical protein